MNPFNIPDKIYIYTHPQDMRAGIERLSYIVVSEIECDPLDGSLYCFVSKDLKKIKMLKFDMNGWCMVYGRLSKGCFRYRYDTCSDRTYLTFNHTKLSLLLQGLDPFSLSVPKSSTEHNIL